MKRFRLWVRRRWWMHARDLCTRDGYLYCWDKKPPHELCWKGKAWWWATRLAGGPEEIR